jgi:uncharacterized protein YbjQ (UPF0145 family)
MSESDTSGGPRIPGQAISRRPTAPATPVGRRARGQPAARGPATNRPVLVVTTENLPGFRIRHIFGEVLGVVARPRNPYVEGVKALSGRRVDPDASAAALMRVRQDAIARLVQNAWDQGANAVIGLRFDHREISAAWTEICVYGTAVLVERSYEQDAGM